MPLRLDAGNPGPMTGVGNNTWLLDGRVPTLVDAGVGRPEHLATIARQLGGRPLAQVLVTHGHGDHLSGAPALQARWPSVAVLKFPSGEASPWGPLADGQRLDAGDGGLEVIHTPGHAPDHVCFWDATTRALFGGDMVLEGTTVMIPAGRGGSMRLYLDSLARLVALSPDRIYPGHGPIIERPVERLEEFIRHRQMREAQVLSCLALGVTDLDGILARVYPDLPEAVHPAARQTIQAHLDKLAEEGRLPKRTRSSSVE